MNALKTGFYAADSSGLRDVENALMEARHEGAPDHANVFTILGGVGPVFKVEWSDEEPNPAGPPADTREQPVQAEDIQPNRTAFATGGVIAGFAPVLVHEGEALIQPDGLKNDGGQ